MEHILFSTRKPESHYQFIINSIILNLRKKKINIKKIIYPKKKKITVNFIIFLISNIINLNLFRKKKIVYLNYRNCCIGRYIIATTFREFSSYFNRIIFIKNLIKNLCFSI